MLLNISLSILYAFSLLASPICRPEQFGARGDGISDDAPFLNKCIAKGKVLSLSKGKTYAVKSSLSPIESADYTIEGNGATIYAGENFKADDFECFFHFRGRGTFIVKDLNIVTCLPQKFEEDRFKVGDTYFFLVDHCSTVLLSNVSYRALGRYDNSSFFVTDGCGALVVDGCNIESASLSKQGGAIWFMNRYLENCFVTVRNSSFSFDDMDECVCVSVGSDAEIKTAGIVARFDNCTFSSPCRSKSSGHMISYNNAKDVEADISISFNHCNFVADGPCPRKILSYQLRPDAGYSSFRSSFSDCSFRFECSSGYDGGLLGLLPADCHGDSSFSFERCDFKIKGISPLIGDKDGITRGLYSFRDCSIESDGSVFVKKYNQGEGEIDIVLDGSSVRSEDSHITTESIRASHSSFLNPKASNLTAHQSGIARKPLKDNIVGCRFNGDGISDIEGNSYPLYVRVKASPASAAYSELFNNESILVRKGEKRDFFIYYYSERIRGGLYVDINGKRFPLTYLDDENCYFTNVPLSDKVFHSGENIVRANNNKLVFIIKNI